VATYVISIEMDDETQEERESNSTLCVGVAGSFVEQISGHTTAHVVASRNQLILFQDVVTP
jgi:hypothetical protein